MNRNEVRSHSVEDLTDQQLHCRIYGHAWDDGPIVDDKIGPLSVGRQTNECPCGVRRNDILDDDGEVWSRSYDYSGSPGFLMSINVDRATLRVERRRRERAGDYRRKTRRR